MNSVKTFLGAVTAIFSKYRLEQGERKVIIIDGKLPTAPIPKGAKEYYFDERGEFVDFPIEGFTTFKCIAINDSNAKRKFNNWKNSKQWVAAEL